MTVIDGNHDTVAQPAAKGPSAYEVDPGKVMSVGRVAVSFGKNAYPVRFDIAVSDDGVVWRTVLEKKAHDGAKSEVKFVPVDARFVQILGLTPAKADAPMAVAELECIQNNRTVSRDDDRERYPAGYVSAIALLAGAGNGRPAGNPPAKRSSNATHRSRAETPASSRG